MDKRIKVFLVLFVAMLGVSLGSSALTMVGVSDALFPSLPYIGSLPIVGTCVLFAIWWFWIRKQKI